MAKINTRYMVQVALWSGIAVVLFYTTEVALIPGMPYLKFDLSDLPVMIAGFSAGPLAGLLVAFIKNIIHVVFGTQSSGFIGEIANFAYASFLMLPFALWKPKKQMMVIIHSAIAITISSLLMITFNYFVVFPVFGIPSAGAWTILFKVYLPFNMVKGVVLSIIFQLLKPTLTRLQYNINS